MVSISLLSAAVAASIAANQRLPNIEVIGRPVDPVEVDVLDAEQLQAPHRGDLAELLRSVNGVGAGRMGGHGLEPVIRGQSQGQINVRIDGMEVYGGCPNRMDPPTAFVQPASLDRVVVHKGVQSLRYGPGGGGGAILIERGLPWQRDGLSGTLAFGGADNGSLASGRFDLNHGGERVVWRVSGSAEDHGNYEDGAGDPVRSAFERRQGSARVGWQIGAGHQLELAAEHSEARDVLYAGAGMDAPDEQLDAVRLEHRAAIGDANLTLRAFSADVEHRMDNFSLRPRMPGTMAMSVPSESDSSGIEFGFQRMFGDRWSVDAGLQQARNRRNATRFAGPSPDALTMTNALLWPDVVTERVGGYLELEFDPSVLDRIIAGVRVDRFRSDARRALQPVSAAIAAPAAFYTSYYGDHALSRSDDGIGALLRAEHRIAAHWTTFGGVSRSVRAPDATERYIASTAGMPSARWIGNPGLAPETHHQFDAGLLFDDGRRRASAVAFVDSVAGYVLRDRARGQSGVLLADGASVYRNIDARLVGLELESGLAFGDDWQFDAQLAWVRGDNRSDDRPLAQIPPLSAQLRLRRDSRWGQWTATARGAAQQRRVDADASTGSGLDAGRTPGWGVLDLQWRRAFGQAALTVQIDNLFDRLYADHLNRANQDPFNPDPVQVNEPGRTIQVGWEWRF